jgi:small subunit ribosomal protein S1
VADHPKGSIVKGTISTVDAKGAEVDLGSGVTGYVRASDLSRDRVEDARQVLVAGQEIEARFMGVDRKNRMISLSVKHKEMAEEAEAMQEYSSSGPAGTSLGDIMKDQMGGDR